MAPGGISCAYCGGRHADATEVRACWGRTQQPVGTRAAGADAGGGGVPGDAGTDLARLAGPPALGRNLVLPASADVPAPWRGCETLLVEPAAASGADRLADHLLELAHARTPVVARLAGPFEPPRPCESRPPWQLGPRFRLTPEVIWHAVWAHAVDLSDAIAPRLPLVERALALGAHPAPSGEGDVVLGDGTPAFCDGGPLRFLTGEDLGRPGAVVVHRVALEHGSLAPFATNASGAELAPDQLAAVTHPGGAARVVAPAGSGKTRVLTERARHLLRSWRLPGGGVCLVAFNVRAAGEMRERTADLPELQVRTLNSLALAVLNGTPPFRRRDRRVATIDEPEVRRLLDTLVELPRRANTDPAAAWIEALSAVRLGLEDPQQVEDGYGGDVDGLPEVFDRYRRLLAERGAVDFDEQIYGAVEALLAEPDTRAAAQRACRLLLVDELQDLTPAHLLLIRLVAGPDAAVFGVGDDDQTIYGYSGASPEWLLRFAELFPGAGAHALEVNYRCPPPVVAAADRLLRRNRRRVEKRIRSAPGRAEEPDELRILGAGAGAGDVGPAAATAAGIGEAGDGGRGLDATAVTTSEVARLVAAGARPDDVAVLARVNAALAPVQVALGVARVPVRRVVDEAWLERTGVRAALAWLRLAARPARLPPADVEVAARRPPRALSPRVVQWMGEQRSVEKLRGLAGRLGDRDGRKVGGFADDVERLAGMAQRGCPVGEVLAAVRDQVGLDQAMQSLEGARRRLDRSAQTDDLDALLALATLHPDATTFERWLREELRRPGATDGVTLATVHSVKGREWPHVVVHHATRGVMPHRLAADVEEERRVFHVAVTRGVRTVTVVAGHPPSPFVAELSRDPADDPPPPPAEARPAGGVVASRVERPRPPGAAGPAGELLRQWRRARAAADGKPAFTILHDATLDAIAAALPASRRELASLKGIGPAKLDRYGDEILAVVAHARSQ